MFNDLVIVLKKMYNDSLPFGTDSMYKAIVNENDDLNEQVVFDFLKLDEEKFPSRFEILSQRSQQVEKN